MNEAALRRPADRPSLPVGIKTIQVDDRLFLIQRLGERPRDIVVMTASGAPVPVWPAALRRILLDKED